MQVAFDILRLLMGSCIAMAVLVRLQGDGPTREYFWPPFRFIWTRECSWLVLSCVFGLMALGVAA